jgi:DNA-binding MarR family transcriptional regulator
MPAPATEPSRPRQRAHKRYDRLETKGYIKRSPQSRSMQDMLYEITDAGKAALRAVGGAAD